MNIVLIGIQGSGKGTLVQALGKHLNFSLISVGQLLREEIATGSELGKYISSVIDKGNLLDTATVMQVIDEKLKNTKDIAVFDGFPRNKEQADELDKIAKVDLVIYLNLSKEIAKQRIVNRLTCAKCGNVTSKLISNSKICAKCGGKLAARVDDTPEAVEKRFEQYYSDTYPLLKKYEAESRVVELDATKPTNELLDIILEVIK